jgi:O-antigen/teichoic acid export membrane protein
VDRPPPEPPRPERNETPAERLDRNLDELLAELRVSVTGVQVLFAFLLSLPFTNRFGQLSSSERDLYLATLMLTAVTSAVLIAPAAYHRWLFRQAAKARVVAIGQVLALVALILLATSITLAVALVVVVLSGATTAVVIASSVYVVFLGLWVAAPLAVRGSAGRDHT